MAAAIVKTIYLSRLGERGNFTYETAMLSIWVVTEQYMIIIAACIPPLGPLFKMIVKYPSTRKSKSTRRAKDANETFKRQEWGREYHHEGGKGKFKTLRSGTAPDFQGYALAEYSVTTWTRTRWDDDRSFDDDAGSEVAIALNRTRSSEEDLQPGGIMRTLEIQIQSDIEGPGHGNR